MIYTVFTTSADPAAHWQSELLEYSWRRVKQPGELVRLVASRPGETAPRHHRARVVPTLCWSPHPHTGDAFAPYDRAASILEWLFREHVDGTVLLVDPDCVFRSRFDAELAPGQALATPHRKLRTDGEGPFGLGPTFGFLAQFCVNRALAIPLVKLPLLIHSRDLRRIAARWLELMAIIRAETSESPADSDLSADWTAYAIAAAEAEVIHEPAELGVGVSSADERAPLVQYDEPIMSILQEIVWDKSSYLAWERVQPNAAAARAGRDVLAILAELVERRESGGDLALLRPRRREGVREARVLDRVLLEIPNRAGTLSLNSSAAAIWQLCDHDRSLAEIATELETRFGLQPGELRGDVESTADQLLGVGALDLDVG